MAALEGKDCKRCNQSITKSYIRCWTALNFATCVPGLPHTVQLVKNCSKPRGTCSNRTCRKCLYDSRIQVKLVGLMDIVDHPLMHTSDMRYTSLKRIGHLPKIQHQIARFEKPLKVASGICIHLPIHICVLHKAALPWKSGLALPY